MKIKILQKQNQQMKNKLDPKTEEEEEFPDFHSHYEF